MMMIDRKFSAVLQPIVSQGSQRIVSFTDRNETAPPACLTNQSEKGIWPSYNVLLKYYSLFRWFAFSVGAPPQITRVKAGKALKALGSQRHTGRIYRSFLWRPALNPFVPYHLYTAQLTRLSGKDKPSLCELHNQFIFFFKTGWIYPEV